MELTNKEIMSQDTFYSVEYKANDGSMLVGTLQVATSENLAVDEYYFTFLEDESDRKATEKELELMEELATS